MLKKRNRFFAWPSELRAAGVMSMNYRNYQIIGHNNKRSLYPLVDDKAKTKLLARRFGINTPQLIGVIETQHDVKNFLDKVRSHTGFVVKPAQGSGGKGVLVIQEYTPDRFITASAKSALLIKKCINTFLTF